jgi:uncharacterized membrane protein YhaH (DUF805 family)
MPLPEAPPVAESDYRSRRGSFWWGVPAVATAAAVLVGVTCVATAQVETEDGAGPQRGMAAVFVMFLVFLSFLTLCGAWVAAAVPRKSRPDGVSLAVFVFVFLTAVFLLFAGMGASSLASHSIGGK